MMKLSEDILYCIIHEMLGALCQQLNLHEWLCGPHTN